jgi:hypothetical protein
LVIGIAVYGVPIMPASREKIGAAVADKGFFANLMPLA